MTFFLQDENFLEFEVDPQEKEKYSNKPKGPIKFDFQLDENSPNTSGDFTSKGSGACPKPFIYHKFTNYAIMEADSNLTGIQKLLKVDLINSRLSEMNHVWILRLTVFRKNLRNF